MIEHETVNERERKRITSFIDLVSKGENPISAAETVGSTLEDLATRKSIQEALGRVIKKYYWDSKLDRELVRAKRREILMTTEDERTALKAADDIAGDPDVGLKSAPTPPVTINIGDLKGLISSVESEPLPIVDMPVIDITPEDK